MYSLKRNRLELRLTAQNNTIIYIYIYLIQNSQAVKKSAALRRAMVKKDVKSKVAAKKWL